MEHYIKLPSGYMVNRYWAHSVWAMALPCIEKMGRRDGFNHFVNEHWKQASQYGLDTLYEVLIDYPVLVGFTKRRILIGSHTREEWEQKKEQYGNHCFYCYKQLKRLTKDHIIPVRDGGGNTIDNIVPACMGCNRRKGTKPIAKFKEGANLKLL